MKNTCRARYTRWVCVFVCMLPWTACTSESPDTQQHFSMLGVGEPAPAYEVLMADSTLHNVVSGEPLTLLNLWAPWCGPCIQEFPDIERLHQSFQGRGLRIIAVDVDADPLRTVRKFAADRAVTFSVAVDPAGMIQERYQAMGLPSSYLIDAEGNLVKIWTGILPEGAAQTIQAYLETNNL